MRETERRGAERVAIAGNLPGEIMVFNPLSVSQMSRAGAQVETTFSLPLGSLHDIRLTLGDRAVVVKGRVAHSTIGDVEQDRVTYQSGIEFIDLSAQAQAAITDFVEALTSARTPTPRVVCCR